MANRPRSVQETKKEKRDRQLEPISPGMSRRSFLTYLGAGSAALAAGSAGVFTSEAQAHTAFAGGGSTPYPQRDVEYQINFQPIAPTDADELVLPPGYHYNVVRRWGDPVTSDGRTFGYNNDYIAYFPIDALEGGASSADGLLFVNHEYVDSRFVSGYNPDEAEESRTPEQIAAERDAVGGSVIHVRYTSAGTWEFVEDDDFNRRIDANTPIDFTGPAAGADEVQGATEVVGTLANCSGGVTPWNTVLSCEENFQGYYGEATGSDDESEADWYSDEQNRQPPEHYGWVVEIDPFDKDSKPRKHTWLGRCRHENVAINIAPSGRVVAYTGHDEEDQCIYKFISSGACDPNTREANMDLLTDGMLYVADFANGRWVALDYENNPLFRDNGFKSQADVLVRVPEAAALPEDEEEDSPPIGTPLDRCEDIDIHPDTGTVYAALTNNALHGNFHGQIIRMFEADGDPEATEFSYEVFAVGGPNTGFSSPDNLAFDSNTNLWMVTDISSSSQNQGIYEPFKNNGMFFMPNVNDMELAEIHQFASGPVECEMTGPAFTPDGSTMFLAVQHPGEESESVDNPSSTWPDGDIPKPSIVAIVGFAS